MSLFQERLTALGFKTYDEYLRSPHWTDFKQRYRDAGRHIKCRLCKRLDTQLHHVTYVRLGREEFGDVTPLCKPHHDAVHLWLKTTGKFFVEHTDAAILALSGGTPVRPLPPPKSQSRSKVRRKCELCYRPRRKNKRVCGYCRKRGKGPKPDKCLGCGQTAQRNKLMCGPCNRRAEIELATRT